MKFRVMMAGFLMVGLVTMAAAQAGCMVRYGDGMHNRRSAVSGRYWC